MRRAVNFLVGINMLFIALLLVASVTSGVLSQVVYYTAFVIPVLPYILFIKNGAQCERLAPLPSARSLALSLTFAATLALVCLLLSGATAYLFGLVTGGVGEALSGGVFGLILLHALLPALLEELIFRYIPLSLLAPYSKRWAVLLSALFFSFAHCDLLKLPHTLVAGLVLGAVAIASESILPSVILHFFVNMTSVLWQSESVGEALRLPIFITLGILSLASAVIFTVFRHRFLEWLSLSCKERVGLPLSVLILAAVALFVGIIRLVF